VAIGGIFRENIREVAACRPVGIAVVRAVFEKGDPYENAKELLSQIGAWR
jgi:thiamine-phosphate pyrophosphorylase